mmetsp:Transcript_64603/g.202311  ORF Transcript_64603/g.202311 Transcript_64603/m.202311 type:complete len:396 (-) Transcript_64603:704-1891(-)
MSWTNPGLLRPQQSPGMSPEPQKGQLYGEVTHLIVFVVPDLPEIVHAFAVLAQECPTLLPRAVKVGWDLVLPIARVRDARRVLAGDVGEVVDPGRDRQAVLRGDVAILHDLQPAPRSHGRKFLQHPPVPAVDVHLGHRDVAPGLPAGPLGGAVHPLPTDVAEAQDAADHVHQPPDPLDALAGPQVLDDDAAPEGHEADLGAAAVLRLVAPLDLRDEVHGVPDRRRVRRGPDLGSHRQLLRSGQRAPEVAAQETAKHSQEDDASEVPVLRLLVPSIEFGIVQPERQGGMPGVARERVEESRARRQLPHKFPLERDCLSQLGRLVQDLLAHPLKLQAGEVPNLCDLALGQVFLNGCKLPHVKPKRQHAILIQPGERQLGWSDQINVNLAVQPEAINL